MGDNWAARGAGNEGDVFQARGCVNAVFDVFPASCVIAQSIRIGSGSAGFRSDFTAQRPWASASTRWTIPSISIPGYCHFVLALRLVAQRLLQDRQLRFDIAFHAPPLDDVLAITAQEIVDGLDADAYGA